MDYAQPVSNADPLPSCELCGYDGSADSIDTEVYDKLYS